MGPFAVAVLPAILVGLIGLVGQVLLRRRAARAAALAAERPSLESVLSAMHRLDDACLQALSGSEYAQAHHVRSLRLAYDQALTQACDLVGVHQDHDTPLTAVERVEMEAALTARGLSW